MIFDIILLVLTFICSVASLFLKKSSGANGILELIKNMNLYIGVLLYLISAILNIGLLKYADYSIVLPRTSLTYIWTMILAMIFLKEKLTKGKLMGAALIVIGAACIAR